MGVNHWGFKSSVRRSRKHTQPLGSIVTVHGSDLLGVGSCQAMLVAYHEQGYAATFGPGDEFDVDFQFYILIGPPLNGKLVRAE
jgi:hypothetical protein